MNSLNNWTKACSQAKGYFFFDSHRGSFSRVQPCGNILECGQEQPWLLASHSKHRQLLPSKGYVYNYKKIFSSFRSVITDQARRGQFERNELETITIKAILKSQRLDKNYNFLRSCGNNRVFKTTAYKPRRIIRLSKYELRRSDASPAIKAYMKPRGTVTRVRNRCVITGRSSIVGSTGLSRISFRQRAGLGKIPGLLKI